MFGRATIRLGIGPHSSYAFFFVAIKVMMILMIVMMMMMMMIIILFCHRVIHNFIVY